MKQSRAVVVGIVAVGGFLYLRSKRTPTAAPDVAPAAGSDLGVSLSALGGPIPFRGLVPAWDRTSTTDAGASGSGSGDSGSGDAGQSIFANAGVGLSAEPSGSASVSGSDTSSASPDVSASSPFVYQGQSRAAGIGVSGGGTPVKGGGVTPHNI